MTICTSVPFTTVYLIIMTEHRPRIFYWRSAFAVADDDPLWMYMLSTWAVP